MITFEDFSKINLKIARILEAQKLEKSEKLIQLKIQVDKTTKQIIAGIGKYYPPEQLIGKLIVIVDNLQPKEIMGFESQGMLLAAKDLKTGEIALLVPDKEVEPGSQIS